MRNIQVAEKQLWKSSVGLEKADFITEQRFREKTAEKENSDKLEDQRCDGRVNHERGSFTIDFV